MQWMGVASMIGLFAAMWIRPEPATALFWRGLIPLIPALLLVHPSLWRNVCPLATLSIGPNRPTPPRPSAAGRPDPGTASSGPAVVSPSFWPPAILLLCLIAARPLGLEDNGPASATLLLGLGTAAFVGRRGERKSGFCNRHCPVLAVERLYGQSPLVPVANVRCEGCSACTRRGCLDLSPAAASAQLLGPGRGEGRWLRTPLGTFASIFPGIVVAFNTLPANPSPLRVLVGLAGWALLSGLLSRVALRGNRIPWRTGFRALAALSAALHLGFSLPGVARIWGWPAAGLPIQAAGIALVLFWFTAGARRPPRLV